MNNRHGSGVVSGIRPAAIFVSSLLSPLFKLFLTSVLLVLTACKAGTPPPPVDIMTADELETVAVTSAVVPREISFDGRVEAVNQSTLSAQTSGRIEQLPFDVGDFVETGDLIVQISTTEQVARVESARAAVDEAVAQRADALAKFKRARDLYDQKLVAKADLDTAATNLNASTARREAARAVLRSADQEVTYTKVHAPFSGMVVQRYVEIGESVAPGTPLMRGLSLERLRAAIDIPQQYMPSLREHQSAQIELMNGDSVIVSSLRFPPNANSTTGTFRVLAGLPEGDHNMFPGNLVKVTFINGEQSRLQLPAASLVRRGEITGAYVVDTRGSLSLRYLRIGNQGDDGYWSVLSGLADGEQVAIDPIAAARVYRGEGSEQ